MIVAVTPSVAPPPTDPKAFIAANLPLATVPGVPEFRLHLATPASGLWRLAAAGDEDFATPYWAYCWGGGLALARHFLDRPETVSGRRVLDLGTGSGLVAIAAAKVGAATVAAADVDRHALVAVSLNAEANGVAVTTVLCDLIADSPPAVDLITVGDMFYEAALAARVLAFLDRCHAAGIDVLIGDPWRAFLPRSRLRLVADYPVLDFGDSAGATNRRGGVFALEKMER